MTQIKEFSERIKLYLKRDWALFLIMLLLFLSGIWLGEQLLKTNPQMAKSIEKVINGKFGAMKEWLKDTPFFVWILVIWINNIVAAAGSFLSGIVVIGPAMFLIYQGVILGLVQKLMETKQMSSVRFYLSLTPHGIIELLAVFIISGLGIRFGLIMYRSVWRWFNGKDNEGLLNNFWTEIRDYSVLVITMLFVAAIIEVTISPLLL